MPAGSDLELGLRLTADGRALAGIADAARRAGAEEAQIEERRNRERIDAERRAWEERLALAEGYRSVGAARHGLEGTAQALPHRGLSSPRDRQGCA